MTTAPSPSLIPDLNLARQLEGAEAAANAAFVEARARVEPGIGATWIEVAGASALFDGVGSPLTQTFGVGVFDPFLTPEFDKVERFFRERGSATQHEVCSLAASASVALLSERGYKPIEESVVLVRSTVGGLESPNQIAVRQIAASEASLWARVAAQGWSSEANELAAFVEKIGHIMTQTFGVHCFIAEADGEPIAVGALNLQSGIALLAGASTIPKARRQGAQRALLQARLSFAAARGVELAMVVTQPGSASQRNAERQGFRPVYTRTKWSNGANTPASGD